MRNMRQVSGSKDLRFLAERYRSQMNLYKSALARMLGLAPDRIGLKLVFTHAGKVVDLERGGPDVEQLSLWTRGT